MKVFIAGAAGQLGYELLRQLDPQKFSVIACTRTQLDISVANAVSQMLRREKPDLIINAAAYTRVDDAESDIANAYAVNRDGAANLARSAAELKIPLLHYSTDYVFDGKKNQPYTESDAVQPLNIYGQSKWAGEEAVRANCAQHIILRVSAIFGRQGVNFVKTMLRLAREKKTLRIVSDQITCPTPAAELARATWQLCAALKNNPAWGTYHYCGSSPVSWFEFANSILALTDRSDRVTEEILPITADNYPTPAQRPTYSVLDCALTEKTFGIAQADWRKGLQDVITELSTA
jgi:dTDP-4-dehydrorhamnose reductase